MDVDPNRPAGRQIEEQRRGLGVARSCAGTGVEQPGGAIFFVLAVMGVPGEHQRMGALVENGKEAALVVPVINRAGNAGQLKRVVFGEVDLTWHDVVAGGATRKEVGVANRDVGANAVLQAGGVDQIEDIGAEIAAMNQVLGAALHEQIEGFFGGGQVVVRIG